MIPEGAPDAEAIPEQLRRAPARVFITVEDLRRWAFSDNSPSAAVSGPDMRAEA